MVARQFDDPDRTEELIAAHLTRLHQLRLQRAALGSQAPPQIVIEITDIEREIARLSGGVPDISNHDLYQIFTADSMRQDGNIWKLEQNVQRVQATLDRLLEVLVQRLTIDVPRSVNGGD